MIEAAADGDKTMTPRGRRKGTAGQVAGVTPAEVQRAIAPDVDDVEAQRRYEATAKLLEVAGTPRGNHIGARAIPQEAVADFIDAFGDEEAAMEALMMLTDMGTPRASRGRGGSAPPLSPRTAAQRRASKGGSSTTDKGGSSTTDKGGSSTTAKGPPSAPQRRASTPTNSRAGAGSRAPGAGGTRSAPGSTGSSRSTTPPPGGAASRASRVANARSSTNNGRAPNQQSQQSRPGRRVSVGRFGG